VRTEGGWPRWSLRQRRLWALRAEATARPIANCTLFTSHHPSSGCNFPCRTNPQVDHKLSCPGRWVRRRDQLFSGPVQALCRGRRRDVDPPTTHPRLCGVDARTTVCHADGCELPVGCAVTTRGGSTSGEAPRQPTQILGVRTRGTWTHRSRCAWRWVASPVGTRPRRKAGGISQRPQGIEHPDRGPSEWAVHSDPIRGATIRM